MPSFNKVILIGHVTRDVQQRSLPNGSTVADFGLAMNRKWRDAQGQDREEVCFVDCTAFGKAAEVIAQYVTKGKPLMIDGRLKFDTWEDKQGGKRSKLSVVVENFRFLGGGTSTNAAPAGASAGEPNETGFADDDIPF